MSESKSRALEAQSKTCSECGTSKPLSEFYKHQTSADRYRPRCKICCRKAVRKRYEAPEIKEQAAKTHAIYRTKKRAKVLCNLARFRAKEKGIAYELHSHEQEIQEIIDQGTCQLTGIPFNLEGGKTWDSPSLDRIDNSLGYTRENTRAVLYCVNIMANLWGPNKILEIAKAIQGQRTSKSDRLQEDFTAALRDKLTGSPEREVIWKPWDTPWGARLSKPRARARRTSEIAFGLYATATKSDATRGTFTSDEKRRKDGRGAQLPDQVFGLWPTTTTSDHKSRSASPETLERNARPLREVIFALWPTAKTTDDRSGMANRWHKGEKSQNGRRSNLNDATVAISLDLWSTLRASDGAKGGPNQTFGAGGSPLPSQFATACSSSNAPTENGVGSLHPEFAGWELGYSPEFLNCAPSATVSTRARRRSS